jgi:hypothetical protein
MDMKVILTENQLRHILNESDSGQDLLRAYQLMAKKLVQRANSLYGTLTQLSVQDLLGQEFHSQKYEKELWSLREISDQAKSRIEHWAETQDEDDNDVWELTNVAHDINMHVHDKVQTLIELLDAMDALRDVSEDISENFKDVSPLEV